MSENGKREPVKVGPLDRLRRLAILLSAAPDSPPGGEILANVVADLRSRGYEVSWIERDRCWRFGRATKNDQDTDQKSTEHVIGLLHEAQALAEEWRAYAQEMGARPETEVFPWEAGGGSKLKEIE